MGKEVKEFYKLYSNTINKEIEQAPFYSSFLHNIKTGTNNLVFAQRYLDHQIDVRWVDAIEDCIIPLDTIIRNPRKFIAQEEDIIPIELARKITTDSIKHLAQHTNMISKVEDGNVTPSKILNIFKEESYETYENRFIYTLLSNLQYFIDKRLEAMRGKTAMENVAYLKMESKFNVGNENVTFKMELEASEPIKAQSNELLISADTKKMDAFSRIERIRKILFDFQNSVLIKALAGCALVKPPIMRTNVLLKNPDFKKCLTLWGFIETYRDAGFSVNLVERNEIPSDKYLDELYAQMMMQYVSLKTHTKTTVEEDAALTKKELHPQVIRHNFRAILDEFDLNVDVVQKIFLDEVKRSNKRKTKEEKRVHTMIARALKYETDRKIKEAELERKRIMLEKKKKQEEREKALRIMAEDRARLAQEKEKIKAQKVKEAEAIKAAKAKEKAEAKALKAKQEKALIKQKAKEKKEKELAKAKKIAALEKAHQKSLEAKEKATVKKALDAQKEAIKNKELKEKLKKAKQEQLALEKAKLDKEKAAEKAILAKQKEKEQAKVAKQKEKEKLAAKALKEKEIAKAKAKALKEKEIAKAKAKALKEKEIAKAKALKEKEANKTKNPKSKTSSSPKQEDKQKEEQTV